MKLERFLREEFITEDSDHQRKSVYHQTAAMNHRAMEKHHGDMADNPKVSTSLADKHDQAADIHGDLAHQHERMAKRYHELHKITKGIK